MRVLIVDDESKARRILKTVLEEIDPTIQVVGEADDVPAAVKAINQYKPGLVFLDVEMPGYSGFELFDFLPEDLSFHVVFVTAYNQYAIKAIEVSAVGYLLKPVKAEELAKVLERVNKKIISNSNAEVKNLRENLKSERFRKIALPHATGLAFENIADILYLKADGSYTQFIFSNRNEILVSKKMKEFENILNEEVGFFRPHRSYIINTQKVKEYIKSDGGYIVMENGDQVSISRELKNEFLQVMGLQGE